MIKKYLLVTIACLSVVSLAQERLDYQLRLESVWSRVADVYGELGSVESVEFSPDGKYIVSGTKFDFSVIMWRTPDGTELWRKYTEQEIERVGWSSDGKYVAACSEDYKVTVYNSKSGEVVKILNHAKGIDGLTWSYKKNTLATGEEMTVISEDSIEGWINVFEFPEGKLIKRINFGNTINELFFSSDDKYLLAVGHKAVKVYNTENWEVEKTLIQDQSAGFTSGVFSPDDKYVIAVGQIGKSRGNCFLWEWRTGKLLKMFKSYRKKIESITWHPNGQYIAHAGHDPFIYIYRVEDIINNPNDNIPVANKIWAGDHAEYLDFNTDGSFLASAHHNGLIKLWVWMGEDSMINEKRHSWLKKQQKDAEK